MISISPSLLGSYEYWLSIEDEAKSEAKRQELLAQVRGVPQPTTDAMLLGSAFHHAVGLDIIGTDVVRVASEDMPADTPPLVFDCKSLAVFRAMLPREALFEMPGRLELPEIDVVMSLRVDAIAGLTVYEFKTGTRAPKPDWHEASAQWRCYLLAFEAQRAEYLVAQLKHRTDRWYVEDVAPFSHFAYPGMREDVVSRVLACKEFIIKSGLAEYREIKN